jgi:hypothetical protein
VFLAREKQAGQGGREGRTETYVPTENEAQRSLFAAKTPLNVAWRGT